MKRPLRIVALVAVIGLILLAIFSSTVKSPEISGKIWNEHMVLGDPATATRHYIVYTDLMCPYCNFYARQTLSYEDDFKAYLAEHKIAYEVRVTDMLYEGSGIEYSRPAAEAAYCAAREDKFWAFYHEAVSSLFKDYYNYGIGDSKTSPKIEDMTRDYWEDIGTRVGLGEDFQSCYEHRETVSEIAENTYKASTLANGLPYFTFGKFSTGGFDSSWDFEVIKEMYDAGL